MGKHLKCLSCNNSGEKFSQKNSYIYIYMCVYVCVYVCVFYIIFLGFKFISKLFNYIYFATTTTKF